MKGRPLRIDGGPDFWVPHIIGPVGYHCFGYDRRDDIAYVGKSEVSLQVRIGQHRREDYWWECVDHLLVFRYRDLTELAQDEARDIRDLQPVFNKKGKNHQCRSYLPPYVADDGSSRRVRREKCRVCAAYWYDDGEEWARLG